MLLFASCFLLREYFLRPIAVSERTLAPGMCLSVASHLPFTVVCALRVFSRVFIFSFTLSLLVFFINFTVAAAKAEDCCCRGLFFSLEAFPVAVVDGV